MPYVTGSGQIVDSEPWSLSYIIKAVGEAFGVMSLFLTTMLPFDLFGSRRQSGNRNTPNRPSSNIRTSRRLGGPSPPPCFGGS
ncbi:hypothetical protein ECG_04282 [Echinococcus granulosus]|uniref:Retrovirus Pol polyprotein n=1 Tax=Echinococcus granulosus TaxID=6210 RepID=A0A068WG68_ECHGR|nr:hypothetical protein ECG_04282 [Echinococcus granulosus]CDS17429.1 Retrovirus Pol polyprotein [Echinococcus granulosus]